MLPQEHVMALLKEGDVYQDQGLFAQAKEKYLNIQDSSLSPIYPGDGPA